MTQLFPNPSVRSGIGCVARLDDKGGVVKLKHIFGVVMIGALLSPMLAVAEDPPIPLPRRADRMPKTLPDGSPVPAAEAASPTATTATPTDSAAGAATQLAKLDTTPQPVTLLARITDGGEDIPDGLVWRVFETKANATGDLVLAAKSEDATAHFELPAGNYVVHVAYGRAQTTDTISVEKGGSTKELVLDAGAIRLNAAVVGDVPIPINQLRFDILSGTSDSDRVVVAQNLTPNDIVTLNAGTYHIVSYFGDVNAVVRADLRVEPGQMTEATIYHKAAQVSFRLVSEAGGEGIADVDWTVKTPDGSSVFTNTGIFPSTVLSEGDYIVLAKRGDKTYQRDFQVKAGPAQEIEVLTAVTDQAAAPKS